MLIEDRALPAAVQLTGPQALDVLRAAVSAVGGDVDDARPCHVRYRPGHELVVRYSASVRWGSDEPKSETIMASTTTLGPRQGTLLATAEHDGTRLEVSIWRWPFDPELVGLADAVTPSSAARLLGHLVAAPVRLDVKAFRPTERAVVHVVGADDRELYLKVVAPAAAARIAELHERLRAAGVPAPAVLDVVADRGIVAMEALPGPTLRELLKSGIGRWPSAEEYLSLGQALALVEPPAAPGQPAAGRATDAMHHAAMLARVLPGDRQRIERITQPFDDLARRSDGRATTTIHGDLYEAQLIIADGRIAGVLDLDDLRRGDTCDDLATVIAHLLARALDAGPAGPTIRRYAERLRDGFSDAVDRRELDLTTAAVLVGLATGPFRIQQPDWQRATRRHLALAQRMVDRAGGSRHGDAS